MHNDRRPFQSALRTTALRTTVLAIVLAIVGCAASTSKVRVDKGDANLGKCQTFDWLEDSKQPSTFADQRIKSAALSALSAKGYTQSAEKPDCKIAYNLSTSVRPKAKPGVGVGVGGGGGGLGGGIGISLPIGKKSDNSSTFTLDIIDASRNAQIWSGSLDAELSGPEPSEEEAATIVKKILAEFPSRK
jgi:hypothetical protein